MFVVDYSFLWHFGETTFLVTVELDELAFRKYFWSLQDGCWYGWTHWLGTTDYYWKGHTQIHPSISIIKYLRDFTDSSWYYYKIHSQLQKVPVTPPPPPPPTEYRGQCKLEQFGRLDELIFHTLAWIYNVYIYIYIIARVCSLVGLADRRHETSFKKSILRNNLCTWLFKK